MKPQKSITILKQMLSSSEFIATHRTEETAFTRERSLTFKVLIAVLMKRTLRSLQNQLNEFFEILSTLGLKTTLTVTASAFTQARAKLSHRAFIELNKKAIIDVVYDDPPSVRLWQSFRLLAIDGSRLRLPETKDLQETFGTVPYSTPKGEDVVCTSLSSVLYDVLNRIPLNGIMGKATDSEIVHAVRHLQECRTFLTPGKDLFLFDRGFPSYEFLAFLLKEKHDFVMRCSQGSFLPIQDMLKDMSLTERSSVVTLRRPSYAGVLQRTGCIQRNELPDTIEVRLILLVLDTGEREVLVTSLLDEQDYPTSCFGELYWNRWGVETFFFLLKSRLHLENFSGKSVEAVLQDYYCTLFVSGLESLLTQEAQQQMEESAVLSGRKTPRYTYQVNRSVSFNAIKRSVVALLFREDDVEELLKKLSRLFRSAAVPVRPGRKVERPPEKHALRKVRYFKYRQRTCA